MRRFMILSVSKVKGGVGGGGGFALGLRNTPHRLQK